MPPKEKAKPKKLKADEKSGPAPPDKAKYKEKIEAIATEITKIQGEQEALKSKLQFKGSEKDEYYDTRNALQCEIQLYVDHISTLNAQKKELRDGLTKKSEDKRSAFNELKKTEDLYRCKTEDEVDQYVQKLTMKLHTDVMPLQDEKRLVQEIQTLKKQKPLISAAAKKIDHLKTITGNLNSDNSLPAKDQISELLTKANQAWEAMELVKKKREALDATWNEKHKGTADIEEKRQALRVKMQELIAEKNKLRDELREEEDLYRQYEKEQYRIRMEKRDAERTAQREEWEKVNMERDVLELTTTMPHIDEIYRIEQSITFLKSLLPKEEVVEKKNLLQEFNNPEGSLVLLSKKDRDEECFYVNPKKKGPSKKNKPAKSVVIKHNAETFRVCEFLKIKAPNVVDQIPDTLTELETQLERYQDAVKEWQRKLDDGTLMKEFLDKRKGLTQQVVTASA